MSDDTTATHFERPRDVLLRPVGDELVALNLAESEYHGFNQVGRRCYELLGDGHSIDETVAVIHAEFEATEDQIRADLALLIAKLIDIGLLRPVE